MPIHFPIGTRPHLAKKAKRRGGDVPEMPPPPLDPPMHTYIRTYIHTYIHTYINTYIHTYIKDKIQNSKDKEGTQEKEKRM